MQIFDISLEISPKLPVWPGDPSIGLTQISFMNKGAECNVSYLQMGVHAGTHVDAPHHFLNDFRTVEKLDLANLIGEAYLHQFTDDVGIISSGQLANASIPVGIKRLLIKTRNSKIWESGDNDFQEDFVAISPDGSDWIVDHGIKLIGMDYLSVAPFGKGTPTHKILLSAGVIALEGLNLSKVNTGFYEMICLPLKLKGSDGAPARVILRS